MDFQRDIAPFRGELLAHAYRMTGSAADAEDALQDALVRAWKAYDRFEGRASLRTWLYKIVTNTCIDVLSARRARSMPELVGPAGIAESSDDPPWLEPFPDAALGAGPEAIYDSRQAVRLAFVVALQLLPARQRASLILRDVVGLSAEETADALETTVASVNSALQRARETIEAKGTSPVADPARVGDVLARYVTAWEAGDPQQLISVLRADAVLSMPPMPLWFAGAEAIGRFLGGEIMPHGPFRLLPCTANGAPAFGAYQRGVPTSLSILAIDGGQIAAIHSFLVTDGRPDFAQFGLPARV